jgi:hypothetical protein
MSGTYTGGGKRDIVLSRRSITIRSTDPQDLDVVAATIIDCQGSDVRLTSTPAEIPGTLRWGGPVFLILQVDAANSAPEEDEDNNLLALPICIKPSISAIPRAAARTDRGTGGR